MKHGDDTNSSFAEERRFGTYHHNIQELVSWVQSCRPEIITMESTGIYWEPLAWALIAAGFSINLGNARHVKALRGHKTDSKDAAWLAKVAFSARQTALSFRVKLSAISYAVTPPLLLGRRSLELEAQANKAFGSVEC